MFLFTDSNKTEFFLILIFGYHQLPKNFVINQNLFDMRPRIFGYHQLPKTFVIRQKKLVKLSREYFFILKTKQENLEAIIKFGANQITTCS